MDYSLLVGVHRPDGPRSSAPVLSLNVGSGSAVRPADDDGHDAASRARISTPVDASSAQSAPHTLHRGGAAGEGARAGLPGPPVKELSAMALAARGAGAAAARVLAAPCVPLYPLRGSGVWGRGLCAPVFVCVFAAVCACVRVCGVGGVQRLPALLVLLALARVAATWCGARCL